MLKNVFSFYALTACISAVGINQKALAAIAVSTLSCTLPHPANESIVVDSSDNIFVSSLGANTGPMQWSGPGVMRITPACDVTLFANITGALGNTLDSSGNLYVTSAEVAGNRKIYRVQPDGTTAEFITSNGAGNLAFDSVGNLYVSSFSNNTIAKYDSFGNLIDSNFASNISLSGPVGLAFDNDDNLYSSGFNNGQIVKIEPDGTASTLANVQSGIGYLAFADNALYATGFSSHLIYRISLAGDVSIIAGSTAGTQDSADPCTARFSQPNGIHGNSSGDKLYVSQYSNGVVRVLDLTTDNGTVCSSSTSSSSSSSSGSGSGSNGGSGGSSGLIFPSGLLLLLLFRKRSE